MTVQAKKAPEITVVIQAVRDMNLKLRKMLLETVAVNKELTEAKEDAISALENARKEVTLLENALHGQRPTRRQVLDLEHEVEELRIKLLAAESRNNAEGSGSEDGSSADNSSELLRKSLREANEEYERKAEVSHQTIMMLTEKNRLLQDQVDELKKEAAKPPASEPVVPPVAASGESDPRRVILIANLHIAGLEAQISAYRATHRDSELLNETAERNADGRRKTKLRLIYELAVRDRARSLGVENPDRLLAGQKTTQATEAV